jgi:ABC-2 type transport system permease protein
VLGEATALRHDGAVDGPRGELVGAGTLIRFLLRVDRVRVPAWVAGIGAFALYVSTAVPAAYGDDLDAATDLFDSPVGRLLTGPGHGLAQPTTERLVAGGYGLYFLLLSALTSILLVVRHTRAEEQSGRAELVRANVVGRHAGLVAALAVAVVANLAISVAVLAGLVAVGGFAVEGSALLAAAVAAVGLAFAGIAAVTAQLSQHSRTTAGLAGGALAAAFVVRGGGDMAAAGGTLLSWLSPLGWGQQTAPYVLDRWWPLLLLVVTAVGTTAVAFLLADRRDLGASFLAERPGPGRAPSYLGTVWGLAMRSQRAGIVGWTASLAVAGFVFGLFTDAMLDASADLPDVVEDLFGTDDLVAGYLGVMALLMAIMVAVYAILAVGSMRTEETSGRGEAVLAMPVSRRAWLTATTATATAGAVAMSGVVGVASGLGAAITTGDAGYVWDVAAAQLNLVPPVLVVLGLATLLFGARPQLVGATWTIVLYAFVVSTFGELLDLPQAAHDLSPFEHSPQMPLEPFAALPAVVLTAVAVGLAGTGVALFQRREYNVG